MASVRISKDGKIVGADNHVKLRPGEEIVFVPQDGGGPWTIQFEGGTPFTKSLFTVPPDETSGPAAGPVDRSYAYKVRPAATPAGPHTDIGVVQVVESLADVAPAVEEAMAQAFSRAVGEAV